MNDLKLKSELDWLNAQGVTQLSTSTWPLTANEIGRALAAANVSTTAQQQVLRSVKATIEASTTAGVDAAVGLYVQSDRQQLPQTFADDQMAKQQLTAKIGYTEQQWEARLQANVKNDDLIDDSDISFEGSYLAGTAANQWLIAGQIPAWWGPGNDGSLIRGDASRPVVGVTMQRDEQKAPTSKYLSWVGPWQYQLFGGQLEDYEAVPGTKLFGMRATAEPFPWLGVGASRTFMWGGEGRKQSFSSFFDALTGIRDNPILGQEDEDPANQLAGFDARVSLASLLNVPGSIYGQYVGEDESGGLPSKNMYLAGMDYASSIYDKPYQLYAEYADTRTGGKVQGHSYNHLTYKDGYYQQGYPLGHGLGGDAESIAIGGKIWLNKKDFLTAKLQYAQLNQSNRTINQNFLTSDTLKAVDVMWSHQLKPQALMTTRLWAVDSNIESADVGAAIGLELKYR
ncbi:capsule assembly Wzi family protein [Psychrobacter sp. 16-MNA-CIBAN-0192]|uniref:capsule assembly Wzi family protein n=1 Tax=Psychrobacter sp. 16-MNA-CIBAN-0192 TaxID=3140448 RepID=UPI00332A9547